MTEELLKATGLYHVFESQAEEGNVVALRGLSVALRDGEAVAVVGPSGAGKSTLLKALGGLLKPSAGVVQLAGDGLVHLPGGQPAAAPVGTRQRAPAAAPRRDSASRGGCSRRRDD